MNIGGSNNNFISQYNLMSKIFPQMKIIRPNGSNIIDEFAKSATSEFNPDDMVNTHGMKGMYIGGGRDWKKIVSVSDDVKQRLEDVVKRDFISTNGRAIPEGSKRNDVIIKYLGTIPAENRSPASWTLGRMAGDYASRLEALVTENNTNWKPGDAFDTSILEKLNGTIGGLDIKA